MSLVADYALALELVHPVAVTATVVQLNSAHETPAYFFPNSQLPAASLYIVVAHKQGFKLNASVEHSQQHSFAVLLYTAVDAWMTPL